MTMRRRDVLAGGAAWAQLMASRSVLAQCVEPSTRAAVVIGVNKSGDLPVLRAAVSGAKAVADWLCGEGFEVKLIVDDQQPVTADAIKRTVTALVNRGTLTQLVIYFSGHGAAFKSSEFWLLTGAPEDLMEAISLVECIEMARRSAIPSVVIISDACRSIPKYETSLLQGTVIFPLGSFVAGGESPDVDRFFGTKPGSPAFELKDGADFAGIYTSTLLDAFKHPRAGMVTKINGADVISNFKLKAFLRGEVPLRLKAANAKITQYPDAQVESETSYIGRALAQAVAAPIVAPTVTMTDIADFQFKLTRIGKLSSIHHVNPAPATTMVRASIDSGFSTIKGTLLETKQPDSFQAETGFSVTGAVVRSAWIAGGPSPQIVSTGDGKKRPALIKCDRTNLGPATAVLMFEDGSGTVVAALPGFLGLIAVEGGLVTSVTYSPSRNSSRWSQYGASAGRIDELRALVTTSAKFGVFRIEGDKASRTATARRLADQIRVLKGIDPTLGIYAAYAYADANLPEQVRSVESFMAGDLGADLFDVALLANKLTGRRIEGPLAAVVPFCPMLTQGWQLLRVREVTLSEDVQRARNDLRPALWTTFGPRGMEFIGRAIQSSQFR